MLCIDRYTDLFDIRDYLDKKIGTKESDEIYDFMERREEEFNKKIKALEDYQKDYELLEERNGNYASCLDKIEKHLDYIEELISVSRTNKTFRDKLNNILSNIHEEINDLEG